MSKNVLVVPTSEFHRIGDFQGYCSAPDEYLQQLLVPGVASFKPRDEMEQDPNYKQIIPYVVFDVLSPRRQVLQYTRCKQAKDSDARLRGKRSIGIGGHIEEQDGITDPAQAFFKALSREIEEEVRIDGQRVLSLVGLINDDSNEVGQVHLGVVHVIDVELPCVYPREEHLIEMFFTSPHYLHTVIDQFETWSQIAIRALFPMPVPTLEPTV